MPLTEQNSIEKVKGKDLDSFSELVMQYQDKVFGTVFGILKNREEAEEVAQDVFVKIYKSIDRFRGDSSMATWIYRIAYNAALDRLKALKRHVHYSYVDEIQEGELDALGSGLEQMEASERNEALEAAMNQLDPKDRMALHLFYFEEMSLKEIGMSMEITENNAKVLLHRSRKRLYSHLKHHLKTECHEHER